MLGTDKRLEVKHDAVDRERGVTLDCKDKEGLSQERKFKLNSAFQKSQRLFWWWCCLFVCFLKTWKKEALKPWGQPVQRPWEGTCLVHLRGRRKASVAQAHRVGLSARGGQRGRQWLDHVV